MKTIYRDEDNILRKSEIEDHPVYHGINEFLFINGKEYQIIDIEYKEGNRTIKMKLLEGYLGSLRPTPYFSKRRNPNEN